MNTDFDGQDWMADCDVASSMVLEQPLGGHEVWQLGGKEGNGKGSKKSVGTKIADAVGDK
jgi:hypothetical protein